LKKKLLIILGLCLTLVLIISLWKDKAVPTQEEVISCLTEKGEQEAEKLLLGYTYEEVSAAWGIPDDTLSGFWGELWKTDNAISIILYFAQDGKVTNAAFHPQAK
jgi:hypothetical protein